MTKESENKTVIGVPELVSIIVGEISFMQSTSACDMLLDGLMIPNFSMDLSTIQTAAIKFFADGLLEDEIDIILEIHPELLQVKIQKFLQPYSTFIDVKAAQQNIYYKIISLP